MEDAFTGEDRYMIHEGQWIWLVNQGTFTRGFKHFYLAC